MQLGKSVNTAIGLTTETLILALVSYVFLTSKQVQEFALLNPEILILIVFVFNFFMGKYIGPIISVHPQHSSIERMIRRESR